MSIYFPRTWNFIVETLTLVRPCWGLCCSFLSDFITFWCLILVFLPLLFPWALYPVYCIFSSCMESAFPAFSHILDCPLYLSFRIMLSPYSIVMFFSSSSIYSFAKLANELLIFPLSMCLSCILYRWES